MPEAMVGALVATGRHGVSRAALVSSRGICRPPPTPCAQPSLVPLCMSCLKNHPDWVWPQTTRMFSFATTREIPWPRWKS